MSVRDISGWSANTKPILSFGLVTVISLICMAIYDSEDCYKPGLHSCKEITATRLAAIALLSIGYLALTFFDLRIDRENQAREEARPRLIHETV